MEVDKEKVKALEGIFGTNQDFTTSFIHNVLASNGNKLDEAVDALLSMSDTQGEDKEIIEGDQELNDTVRLDGKEAEKIQTLESMFGGDLTKSVICTVFHSNKGELEDTVDTLLNMTSLEMNPNVVEKKQSDTEKRAQEQEIQRHEEWKMLQQKIQEEEHRAIQESQRAIEAERERVRKQAEDHQKVLLQQEQLLREHHARRVAEEDRKKEEERKKLEARKRDELIKVMEKDKKEREEQRKREEAKKALEEAAKKKEEEEKMKKMEELQQQKREAQEKQEEQKRILLLEQARMKAKAEEMQRLANLARKREEEVRAKEELKLEEEKKRIKEEKKIAEQRKREEEMMKIKEDQERMKQEAEKKRLKEEKEIAEQRKREEEMVRIKEEQERVKQEVERKRIAEEKQNLELLLVRVEEERKIVAEQRQREREERAILEQRLKSEQEILKKNWEEQLRVLREKEEAMKKLEKEKRGAEERAKLERLREKQRAREEQRIKIEAMERIEKEKREEEERAREEQRIIEERLREEQRINEERAREEQKTKEEEEARKAEEARKMEEAEIEARKAEEARKMEAEIEARDAAIRLLNETQEELKNAVIEDENGLPLDSSAVFIPSALSDPTSQNENNVLAVEVVEDKVTCSWTLEGGFDPSNWVGLYVADQDDSYVKALYTKGEQSGQQIFKKIAPGHYEIRFFTNRSSLQPLARSSVFTVGPVATISAQLQAEHLLVHYTLDPLSNTPTTDWLGIYEKTEKRNKNYLSLGYGNREGRVLLKAPRKPGIYEVRLFINGGYNDQSRAEFIVEDHDCVTIEPNTVLSGDSTSITWILRTVEPASGDWIGLYRAEETNNKNYLQCLYTSGTSVGTISMQAPKEAGVYELRLFARAVGKYATFRASPKFTVM